MSESSAPVTTMTALPPTMSLRNEAAWRKFKDLFSLFKLSCPNIHMRQLITADCLDLVSFLLARATLTLAKVSDEELIKLLDAHFAPISTIELCQRLQRLRFKGEITFANMATYCSEFTRVLSVDKSLHPRKTMLFKLFSDGLTAIPPLVEELSWKDANTIDELVTHAYDFVDRARKSNLLPSTPFLRQRNERNASRKPVVPESSPTTPVASPRPVTVRSSSTPAPPAPRENPWENRLRDRPVPPPRRDTSQNWHRTSGRQQDQPRTDWRRDAPQPAARPTPSSSERQPRGPPAHVRATHTIAVDEKPIPLPRRRNAESFPSRDCLSQMTSSSVPIASSQDSLTSAFSLAPSQQELLTSSSPIAIVKLLPTDSHGSSSSIATECLLDTGSTINLIRKDVLDRLPEDSYFIRKVRPRSMVTADGAPSQTLALEVELLVCLSVGVPTPCEIPTHFYVVTSCSHPVLLSETWLSQHDLSELLTIVRTSPQKPVPISEPQISTTELLDFADYEPDIQEQSIGDPDLDVFVADLLQQYDDLFHLDSEPARFPAVRLNIPTHAQWPAPKPRRMSPHIADKIEAQIRDLQALGMVEPSSSTCVSPMVPVRKPHVSGDPNLCDYRLCVDYTTLNDFTPKVPFAQLHTQDVIAGMAGNLYYAKLDFHKGFFQLPLHEADRQYTAFLTRKGQFQWTRLPQGVTNGTSIFHTYMQHAFQDMSDRVSVYVDDIAVHCRSRDIYIATLQEVFSRCRDLHLVLSKPKCQFNLSSIHFLGYLVTAHGWTIPHSRRQALHDLTPPWNTSSTRSFVGLANCFRAFIPNFSALMKPLTRLCSAKVNFTWGKEQQTAFENIKTHAVNAPLLHFVDPTKSLCLFTDASETAFSGVLLQPDYAAIPDDMIPTLDLARSKPVAYVSRCFDDVQSRWSMPEKELFAVYFSVHSLDHFLAGRDFTVFTDHKNFLYLQRSASPKLVRWRLDLNQYHMTVRHVAGKANILADHLSRPRPHEYHPLPVPGDSTTVAAASTTTLNSSTPSSDSTPSVETLFPLVHSPLVGHHGIQRTLTLLSARGLTITPDVRQRVIQLIGSCAICQKVRAGNTSLQAALHTTAVQQPFHTLYCDYIGPMPESETGAKYILVFVDAFTRFCELVPTPDATATSVASALLPLVGRMGLFQELRSDRGVHFTAAIIESLTASLNIKQVFSLPYRPQAQGIVERLNGEVLRHLRAFTLPLKDNTLWSRYLPLVQRILNSQVHTTTGVAPASMLFGNAVSLNRMFLTPPPDSPTTLTVADYVHGLCETQNQLIDFARQHQQQQVDAYLAKSPDNPASFQEGDHVLLAYPQRPPTKLHSRWRGPYVVTDHLRDNAYRIQNLVDFTFIEAHYDRLRLYNPDNVLDPSVVATWDTEEFDIDFIVRHQGSTKRKSTLRFLVRWLNYGEESDTWEPYASIRNTIALANYAKIHQLKL